MGVCPLARIDVDRTAYAGLSWPGRTARSPRQRGRRRPRRRPRRPSRRPPGRPSGSPTATSPGPFAVGEYAAALRGRLRSFARVQIVGELVNLRPSRARVYFELRDSTGALPCSAWREDWERMLARAGAAPSEGMQVVVAGGCDYYPGSATSSPSFSLRRHRPARRRRGRSAGAHRPAAQAARRARACSSRRSGWPWRRCRARSAW